MKIGITGLMGSGKTLCGQILQECGYNVYEGDEIAWQLYNRDDVKTLLIEQFGDKIIEDKKITREKLREIIGSDEEKLFQIANIMAPFIIKEIEKILEREEKVAIVAALLCFWKIEYLFDKVIMIKDNDMVLSRYNGDKERLLKRRLLQSKWNKDCKVDIVIKNIGTKEEFERSVKNLLCL